MYLNIGSDLAIRTSSVIGIFDLDHTSTGKDSRNFLKLAEERGDIITVSEDIPKTFILTEEYGMQHIWLTEPNAATLEKRLRGNKKEL